MKCNARRQKLFADFYSLIVLIMFVMREDVIDMAKMIFS